MSVKRVAILASGGDGPGMNACLRACVRTAHSLGIKPIGVLRGFDGLLKRDFFDFETRSVANIIQRGGTVLMSSRSKDFMLPEQRAAAFLNLRSLGVDGLIGMGGDGTMRGLEALFNEHGLAICGVPASIDNDLTGTDYSIGFDTAVNTALEMVDKLRDTISSFERVMLVEVMGRSCGEIALHVALAAGAEGLILPGNDGPYDGLIERVNQSHEKGKNSHIIVVAEGGRAGRSNDIAKALEKHIKIPVRVCTFGHVQRGGNPTADDRILASRLGEAAMRALFDGQKGVMVGEVNHAMVIQPLSHCVSRVLADSDRPLIQLTELLAT